MEETKTSFIDDEIFFYSSISNYGVCSKHLKSPKNIHMSYSPLSCNQRITFSNTIMIPYISTEKSIETKKDNTRTKTESSKEEKNNISVEKQITKIFVENEEEKLEENNKDEINLINIEYIEKNDSLERNPYFLGGKFSFDVAKFQNDNIELEKKKVNKILNHKSINEVIDEDPNLYLKTCKELRKKTSLENKNKIKNKSSNKVKRMKSLNIKKLKEGNNPEKEIKDKKIRKSHIKYNSYLTIENKTPKKKGDNEIKLRNSDKNLCFKNIRTGSFRRKRENTIRNKLSNIKIKDNKINLYKASLFNKNSSSKIKIKFEANQVDKDKKNKTKKNDEIKKSKREKKESQIKEGIINKNFIKKASNISFLNTTNVKKVKSLTKETNFAEKKTFYNIISKKKMSEVKTSTDFEKALKSKDNLSKTQFNLFSPDKFTNTQFCGSDYLEYTLDCMELILKSNKDQKQQKNKVNFNFPKPKANKIKKKIALFDLDETLVHCTGDINLKNEPYQHCIEIVLPGNKKSKVGINIRPFWKKTLNLIRKYYYIVVFTASHQAYADAVLNFMDPSNKYFKHRLYRNNCSLVDVDGNKFYVKDLDIFDENYDLKDIIIIDNSVLSFIYHLENGIPIVPYYHEDKDGSLYVVGLYLKHIFKEDDLREANKKYINLESFLNEAKCRKISDSSFNSEESIGSTNIKELNGLNEIDNKNNTKEGINKTEEKPVTEKNLKVNVINNTISSRHPSLVKENIQSLLKTKSKLINMYYEINSNRYITDKKTEEINEEKTNKSFSIDDEEEEMKKYKSHKNVVEFFFQKRQLTTLDKPVRHKSRTRSNKTLHNYLNTKMIRSNFNDYFS